jgi:hypothetical protein
MKHSQEHSGLDVVDDDQTDIDQYQDFQYEYSTEVASQFLDSHLLPQLDEFDWSNAHEDYVPGIASWGLFMKLVNRLLQSGFSADEMRGVIDDLEQITVGDGEVLH